MKDLREDWGNHTDIEIPDCGLFCDLETKGLKVFEIEEAKKKLNETN